MAKDLINEEMPYISNPGAYKFKRFLGKFFVIFLLLIQSLIVILPFYIMILTSVKDPMTMKGGTTTNFEWWIPIKDAIRYATENYQRAYTAIKFGRVMLNTLMVALLGTAGTILTTIFAAYAFARLNFKGKELLFTLFMTTMMVPGEIFVITNYVTVSGLGWVNSKEWIDILLALTIPHMTSVYYIYYLKQTFKSVPDELYYAAKVDGTSDLKYLFKVMIPVCSGTIVSITILNAMGNFNAYIWPTLMTQREEFYLVTQALKLKTFTVPGDMYAIDYATQMAAAFMVTLPLLLVFFAFKKYIMRGVSRSGIKG